MRFLAVGQLAEGADISPLLGAEQQRVRELTEQGVVEHFFLKADRSGSVFVLQAPDETQARQRLDTLPFVQHGHIAFALTALAD